MVHWDRCLPLAIGQVSCTPGEVSCVDGACVGALRLCDGIWDCPNGADEGPGHCPLPSLPMPPAGTLPGLSTASQGTPPTPPARVSPGESPGGKEDENIGVWRPGRGGGCGGQRPRGKPWGRCWGGKRQGTDPTFWSHQKELREEHLRGAERIRILFSEVQGPL